MAVIVRTASQTVTVDIVKLLKKFNEEYNFLYDNRDQVVGYQDALKDWGNFLRHNTEFVREFARYRGDFISSDREVVAFMFALVDVAEV